MMLNLFSWLNSTNIVMILAVLISFCTVIAAFHHAKRKLPNQKTFKLTLMSRMEGTPTWSIQTSWIANITVFGAILNTVISSGPLPENLHAIISKQEFLGLSLFFGVLIIAAPLFYLASVKTDASNAPHGLVLCFIITSWVTLLAVYGQIGLGILLIDEMRLATTLSLPLFCAFMAILLLSVLLLILYARRTIYDTLFEQVQIVTETTKDAAIQALIQHFGDSHQQKEQAQRVVGTLANGLLLVHRSDAHHPLPHKDEATEDAVARIITKSMPCDEDTAKKAAGKLAGDGLLAPATPKREWTLM